LRRFRLAKRETILSHSRFCATRLRMIECTE
jgi:hypothetical protein